MIAQLDRAESGFGHHWLVRPTLGDPGDVVTFYSYKGGTGRSLALVSCAGLIVEQLQHLHNPKPVLLIDFDLEAPGLHRYLLPFIRDEDRQPRLGVLELFAAISMRIDVLLTTPKDDDTNCPQALDDEATMALVDEFDLSPYLVTTSFHGLQLMLAGRFDESYDQRLAAFDWHRLFAKAPSLFRCLSDRFAHEYSFTFIDARTGLSDTSGICTMLLPDVMVVVFTPNTQSLTGIEHLVRRALAYREAAVDGRSLRIYPLPSRVDTQVESFRQTWRMGDSSHPLFGTVNGYQPVFEGLLASGGAGSSVALGPYFDVVQVPHTADYAYGERLCFTTAASGDSLSIRNAYEQFLPWLVTGAQPWERPSERVMNQLALQWLRDSGTVSPHADDAVEWAQWFDRLTRFVLDPGPVVAQHASLSADRRFDVAVVMALGLAYGSDLVGSVSWIALAYEAFDSNLAPMVSGQLPTLLLGVWQMHPPEDQQLNVLSQWLDDTDRLMRRWQPHKAMRAAWLTALYEVAAAIKLPELAWSAQIELDGKGSDLALRSVIDHVRGLAASGDIGVAIALQERLVRSLSSVPRRSNSELPEASVHLGRLRAGRERRAFSGLPAIERCRYSAFISHAHADDVAWDSWISSFTEELSMALPPRLRGIKFPPTYFGSSSQMSASHMSSELQANIAESFAMIACVHDNFVASEWCRRDIECFRSAVGDDGLRERLFLVAMSKSAIKQLTASDWWRALFLSDKVWLPFFQDDHPDHPVNIYVGPSHSRRVVSNDFWMRFIELRETLAEAMNRSLERHRRSVPYPTHPTELLTAVSSPRKDDLLARVYIATSAGGSGYVDSLGHELVSNWDRALASAGSQSSLYVRPTGLPMSEVSERAALDEADGLILVWADMTVDAVAAQVNKIEVKLPGPTPAPGLIAYMTLGAEVPLAASSINGWRIVRFHADAARNLEVVSADAPAFEAFVASVLERTRRRLS